MGKLLFPLILILSLRLWRVHSGCCDNPQIPASFTGNPSKYEGAYCRSQFKDCNIGSDKILCGRDADGSWKASKLSSCKGNDVCKRDPEDDDDVICQHPDGPEHSFCNCKCPNEHPHLKGEPTPGKAQVEESAGPLEIEYCGDELNKYNNYTYAYCPPTSIIVCQDDNVEERKCAKGCKAHGTDKLKRECA